MLPSRTTTPSASSAPGWRTPSERSTSVARPVLVGTDLGASARDVVARAASIARAIDAKLYIVHAASRLFAPLACGGRDVAARERAMASVLAEIRATGVPARAQLVRGGATSAIRRAARQIDAGIVVVGARRRRVPDALVGSTAERIARGVDRPVLVVRHEGTRAYRRAVVAVDPGCDVVGAVAAARLVAPAAELTLVHAYEGSFEVPLLLDGASEMTIQRYLVDVRREARRALDASVASAGLRSQDLTLRRGSSARVIEEEEHLRGGCDALFVVQQGRSLLRALAFGSVCRRLVVRGASDVLLV